MRLRDLLVQAALAVGGLAAAGCQAGESAPAADIVTAEAQGLQRVSFRSNPYCGRCAAAITSQLRTLGVRAITADMETKVFSGYYDPARVTPAQIRAAVEKVGFVVEELRTGEQVVGT